MSNPPKANERTSETIEPLECYDLIIDLNSLHCISSLNKVEDYGARIRRDEKGFEKYEYYKNKSTTVVGMLGYSNAGKSFILSKLTSLKIPDGYAIQTKGISIKYPISENSNFTCLDSEGSEMPITETSYLKNSDNDTLSAKEYYEKLKFATLDKKATEIFIQNFLLEYCNILVIVLGAMAFRDQMFLNRIKRERGIEKIFVCHNLKDFVKKEQVLTYIDTTFKNDIFLNCEKRVITNMDDDKKDVYGHYFYEKIKHPDDTNTDMIHIFFANDVRSEENTAADYFNDNSTNFLQAQIKSFTSQRTFDAIEKFKKFLIKNGGVFFEHDVNLPCIEEKDIKFDEGEKIYVEKELKLKECNFDEFGKSNFFSMNIVPDYSYYIGQYKNEKKKKKKETDNDNEKKEDQQEYECLIIEIELPGKIENPELNLKFDFDTNKQCFTFKAKKVDVNDENIETYNNDIRKGNVELAIYIDMDECKLDMNNKERPIKCKHSNGLFIVYIPTINEKENNNNVIVEVQKKKKKKKSE